MFLIWSSIAAGMWPEALEAAPVGQITRFGIYVPQGSGKRILQPGSSTGYITEGGQTFQSAGTNVTLAKGISFGFDFQISGAPTNEPIRLRHVISHPTMHTPDGKTLQKQEFVRDVMGNSGVISGTLWYTLREDYELLPGEWTLSVMNGPRVLAEKRFMVAPPPSAVGGK